MLINSIAVPGTRSRPAVTAAATRHGDTVNTDLPHRATTAAAAATIAATASANSAPVGSGTRGAGSRSPSNAVNTDRNGPARESNRRNQPRTVVAGRASRSAIRRWPQPRAAQTRASPITPTTSARRTRQLTGNKMCVAPQPEQRARRGRNRQPNRPSRRNTRGRPYPHGTRRPSHPGHANRADDNLRSTSAGSLPTVSTASPHATNGPPGGSPKTTGRANLQPVVITLSSHTKKGNPNRAAHRDAHTQRRDATPTSSHGMTLNRPLVTVWC